MSAVLLPEIAPRADQAIRTAQILYGFGSDGYAPSHDLRLTCSYSTRLEGPPYRRVARARITRIVDEKGKELRLPDCVIDELESEIDSSHNEAPEDEA